MLRFVDSMYEEEENDRKRKDALCGRMLIVRSGSITVMRRYAARAR